MEINYVESYTTVLQPSCKEKAYFKNAQAFNYSTTIQHNSFDSFGINSHLGMRLGRLSCQQPSQAQPYGKLPTLLKTRRSLVLWAKML